jgi:hypothetical protein
LVSFPCLWTGKEGPFDRAHGHELVEWSGEIFESIRLLTYGLLGKWDEELDEFGHWLFGGWDLVLGIWQVAE